MNNLDAFKSSQSASFRKKNPHLFNAGGEDDAEHDHIEALTAPKPKKKRIRQCTKPLLNGLETEWLTKITPLYPASHITAQAIRFSLGNGIAYKADFVVFSNGRTVAYECKGPYAHRGGFENLKVAASKYPYVTFILVWKDEQGQWREQHVLP